ncbi:MAG: family 16 glycoside hydrolase [Cyclobacteriaceae bacterium]
MRLIKFRVIFLLTLALCAGLANAQTKTLTLQDLSDFKPQAGNWLIVGDATMNPDVDIHEKTAVSLPEETKKGKKAKAAILPAKPQAVTFTKGTGILLNMNDDKKKDHLISVFEHGDIELELEVMLPKGSNSGIYLQGRYEIQLLDSWGVKNPKYSDIGGIYRNWENEPGKIYMGKAPLSNPAKAPGLWQKMKISFQAPRFDKAGSKIENARFNYVDLNGVRIHENVEVPLPTGGPIENNERPLGPLMIQGDHGPVAFRNVTYTLMKSVEVSLSNITYQTWYGNYKIISDYSGLKPSASGQVSELTCEVLENEDGYGSRYQKKISVSEDSNYKFRLTYTGGARLIVNNQQLTDFQSGDGWWRTDEASIELKAGSYPFEIYNYKNASWLPPRLGLFVQTGSLLKPLHAFNSFPPDDQPVAPILINPGNEPRMLRAFLDFKGDYKQRLTHTIGVGDPSGLNYVYDLKAGNLVCVWRGDFVDATPMWHDRGDGSFKPMGATQYLFNNQPMAFLPTLTSSFPVITRDAEIKAGEFRGKGYEIEEATGRPIFKYTYQGIDVEDKIYPDQSSLTHEVNIKNRDTKSGLYYKLAEGKAIQQMPNGMYAVDDKSYYIRVKGVTPKVRENAGKQELIIPMEGSFSYSIIW